ncbi:MAG: hypothetical protein K1X74_06065 [Pirellulales bacterium]|nr:hypothetical protein [Pirellulales bacterium]
MVDLARMLLLIVGLYLMCGAMVGVPFVLWGVGRIDPAAHHAPWTFRLLILPGSVALWPWMAMLWRRTGRRETRP